MRHFDRKGHQCLRLTAGITEHHALVSGTVVQKLFTALFADAACNIRRLLVQIDAHRTALGVKAVTLFSIADLGDHLSCNLLIVYAGVRADFPENMDLIGGAGDLTGYMGLRILPQQFVENAVRDLIADLVRVAPGHGFGGKYAFFHRK